MYSYEAHILNTVHDITLATDAGLIDEQPGDCGQCGTTLAVPFTLTLGADDISVSRCSDCFPVLS